MKAIMASEVTNTAVRGNMHIDTRVRGLPLSTYAQRGRGGVGPNAYVVYRLSQARLGEFAYKGGRGVQKAGKSAYVLNVWPLRDSRNKLLTKAHE